MVVTEMDIETKTMEAATMEVATMEVETTETETSQEELLKDHMEEVQVAIQKKELYSLEIWLST